jgi:hypothetical protein
MATKSRHEFVLGVPQLFSTSVLSKSELCLFGTAMSVLENSGGF